MIDLGQYDAIKTTPNDDDGVFIRFRQLLLSLKEDDDEREAQALRSSFAIDNSNNS